MSEPCLFAWAQAYIHFDGSVRPCCANIPLGSLDDVSLREAFCSAAANTLRTGFANGEIPEDCRNCLNLPRLGRIAGLAEYYGLNESDLMDGVARGECPQFLWENLQKVRRSFARGAGMEGADPIAIVVTLGERCNIRCIMCPQDHDTPAGLSTEQLLKIRESIANCFFLTFSGGEPLVYPSYWEIVEHFQKVNHPVQRLMTLTNGHLLTRDRMERYFLGIENLGFGINFDACTAGTYEAIRIHGKWSRLIRNITDINTLREKHGKRRWDLMMGFTIMKSNLHELKGAIELAADLDMGFGCGPVTGDVGPVKNVRAFFTENIFRFSHLGCSVEEIEAVVEDALPSVRKLREKYRQPAEDNLRGVVRIAKGTRRLQIRPARSRRMLRLSDEKLAEKILALAVESPRLSDVFLGRFIGYCSRIGNRLQQMLP